MKLFSAILVTLLITGYALSQQVILHKKDAAVWGMEQLIKGKINSITASQGTLYLNGNPVPFSVAGDTFRVPVVLGEGLNTIIAEVNNGGTPVYSDTLKLTLAYNIRPDVFAYAEASGNSVTLKTTVKANPLSDQLFFQWNADEKNPAPVAISGANDSLASVTLPSGSSPGEYYFNLLVTTSGGDTTRARTYVTVNGNNIVPFNIKTDHAAWIDTAVIYEVTPYIFVNTQPSAHDKLNRITQKIPDLVRLGINTIWLQPIFQTHNGGQGYDITDYFSIRPDYGTETDLKNLVQTAKSYGMKVMLDFVANHSSINHPYAVNSTQYGTDSHYWDYYQREEDNAPYSNNYHHYNGFINYFWNELPNLNYNNPEVQKWMIEAMKYWIEKFDIDGYRYDAIWGVTARKPQFTKDMRIALKSLKPDVLLLAEDKASQSQVFDERFDVAFDWTPEYDWVSHWAWQTSYSSTSNPTIFNYSNASQRSQLLRNAVTNNGNGFAPNAKVLHFLDNNDQFYFITHHDIDRVRMAAVLEFTLQGVPLVYNGDEIGMSGHPYEIEYIFYPGRPIDYDDQYGLFPYYQNLIKYKKTLPALIGSNYEEISVTPSNYVFGFRRWQDTQNVFTILNMGAGSATVSASLPVNVFNLDTAKTYYLTDLLSGDYLTGKLNELANISVSMNKYSAKVYLLADYVYPVTAVEGDQVANVIPDKFILSQNYPNPFNPVTKIKYSVPAGAAGNVQLNVYDILGKEIATLVNEQKPAGEYEIEFDASRLPSGVYFYRLNSGSTSIVKKMMLLK